MTSLLPPIRPAAEHKKIISFIKSTVKNAKYSKLILAASGGVDSSVSLALATQAVGAANIVVLKLPYHKQLLPGKYVDLMGKHLKIPKRNIYDANIAHGVERIWKSILIRLSRSQTGQSKLTNQIRLGNIMARVRMVYLFDMAKARNCLVIGTENKSEHMLGYY